MDSSYEFGNCMFLATYDRSPKLVEAIVADWTKGGTNPIDLMSLHSFDVEVMPDVEVKKLTNRLGKNNLRNFNSMRSFIGNYFFNHNKYVFFFFFK